jgi:hypothetical protein
MKAETMYECEKENQEYLDSLNLKSSCCNDDLIATTMDNWLCVACGQEHKPEVDSSQPLDVKQEGGKSNIP